MKQEALVIVDIQNDYFPGGNMELDGMEAAAKNAQRVLEFFRIKINLFSISSIYQTDPGPRSFYRVHLALKYITA